MNILFGFEKSDFTGKLLKLLDERSVGYTATYRSGKVAVKDYIAKHPEIDTVILQEYNSYTRYGEKDFLDIADIRESLNIIAVLDATHRGTDFMQSLLAAGIFSAVFQEDGKRGVSSLDLIGLVVTKRSREEARRYYGLEKIQMISPTITEEQYRECLLALSDEELGANLSQRYVALVGQYTALQNADFLEKLNSYDKVTLRQLMQYKEFYDVVDLLAEENIKLSFKTPRPKKLLDSGQKSIPDALTQPLTTPNNKDIEEPAMENGFAPDLSDSGAETDEVTDNTYAEFFGDAQPDIDDEEDFPDINIESIEEELADLYREEQDADMLESVEETEEESSGEEPENIYYDDEEEDSFTGDFSQDPFAEEAAEETEPESQPEVIMKGQNKAAGVQKIENYLNEEDGEEKEKQDRLTTILIIAGAVASLVIIVLTVGILGGMGKASKYARERQEAMENAQIVELAQTLDETEEEEAVVPPQQSESEDKKPSKKIAVTKVSSEELAERAQSVVDAIDEKTEEITQEEISDVDEVTDWSYSGSSQNQTTDVDTANTSASQSSATTGQQANGGTAQTPSTPDTTNTTGSTQNSGGSSYSYTEASSDDTGSEPEYTSISKDLRFDYEPDKKKSEVSSLSEGDLVEGLTVVNYINSQKSGTYKVIFGDTTIKIKAGEASVLLIPADNVFEVGKGAEEFTKTAE